MNSGSAYVFGDKMVIKCGFICNILSYIMGAWFNEMTNHSTKYIFWLLIKQCKTNKSTTMNSAPSLYIIFFPFYLINYIKSRSF